METMMDVEAFAWADYDSAHLVFNTWTDHLVLHTFQSFTQIDYKSISISQRNENTNKGTFKTKQTKTQERTPK
jgi:hypothetical protein